MVNKTSIMEYIRQDSYRPLSFEDLMIVFQVEAEEQWKFARVLGSLEKQGEIVKTRKNKYGLPEKMNLAKGVINLSQRGYGFITPDQPDTPEIFVYGRNLNGAMHHDKYKVSEHFDNESMSPYFTYWDEQGQSHQIWMENQKSLQSKLNTAIEAKVGGISFWRIGNGFYDLYEVLDQSGFAR
jgi:exoribonuclease R